MEQIYNQIIKGIKTYFEESKHSKAVVGLSGGVDSALTLKLVSDAIDPKNVTAICLPELGVSKPENIHHAKVLAEAIGVTYIQLNINSHLLGFAQLPWKQTSIAMQNSKARMRALILYNFANTKNALVIGSNNKSELTLGYTTKYGDTACDLMPIGDLFKSQVIELANYIELPPEIIDKEPSAELYEKQTDSIDLGGSYGEIDPILNRLQEGSENLINKGMKPTLIHNIFNRVERNKHKRKMPPIIKMT